MRILSFKGFLSTALAIALGVILPVFACGQNAPAPLHPHRVIAFSTPEELFKMAYEKSYSLQVGETMEVRLPSQTKKDRWLAQIDWASSSRAGTPKKPRIKLTYLESSSPGKSGKCVLNGLVLKALDDADVMVALTYQSHGMPQREREDRYARLHVKTTKSGNPP